MIDSREGQPARISFQLPLQRPIVTWILLAIIVVVFGLETLAGGSTSTEVLVQFGAKVNPLIAAGQFWRLFTAMFLHIGLMHLLLNGYALVVLGTELERILDWRRFLAIYLLSGLLGSLVSYAFNPNIAAGASGAIFGLVGALGAFFALHREQLGSWGQRRLINVIFLVVVNLILGFTQQGIDNYAHMGGLVFGFALGWALAPRYQIDPIDLKLVDGNRLARYWPALAIAVVLLIGGTALTTMVQRESIQSYLWRAEQAAGREAWDEVVTELEGALAHDPDAADATIYFSLGLARNYLDEPRLASEAYEAALELDPDDSAARWNLALTYLQLRRYAQARSQFEAYLKLNPGEAVEVQPYLEELRRLGY